MADAHAKATGEILYELLPPRRLRTNSRVVKRKMSNYGVKRTEHRLWPQPSRTPTEAARILRPAAAQA